MEKRISVRNLVEFIMRSGSIDSRFTGANRMEEGSRVHKKLQRAGGEDYLTEVHLSITEACGDFVFTVEGRADGIIVSGGLVTVDEIKSTLTPLEKIDEDYSPVHWAQAMCYGHIYSAKNNLEQIDIRLTYYEMDTGGIKRFTHTHTAEELSRFFTGLLEQYSVWTEFEHRWRITRDASIKPLLFPFDNYREGQRRLAAAVYKTIAAEGRLFAMAPTGIGKTVSALFPAIKAIGEGHAEKVFYLTAKTVTRQAADSAVTLMRERGLKIKSVVITAKDKICFLDERACNPGQCLYADGHFDRINAAIMDVLQNRSDMTAESVREYAMRHRVCPFELSLDLTLWSDIIICDYNYLFDPLVYLRRFFADGGDYVFLIDEAHNLADRARDMYSASVSKRELLAAKKMISKANRKPRSALTKINAWLLEKLREQDAKESEKNPPLELISRLELFSYEFSKFLAENPEPDGSLLEVYFNVLSFLRIAELYDERYVTLYERAEGGELIVKLFCADPSLLLDDRFKRGRAAILFSATLSPPGYFMSVLGGGPEAKALVLPSPFPRKNLLLLIAGCISTKYRERERSYEPVADMIKNTAEGKTGNYIAFFPSYSYLRNVYAVFREKYPDISTVCQQSMMTETERDDFLQMFEDGGAETLVAFCVLGGIFSEGIDLRGDKLIGTIIVGVGLPQINTELDIVRDYYGGYGGGFDFAYRFPGMNKVLQAAGRVIRSESDIGVVLLIDERFASRRYTELFPEHWRGYRMIENAADLTCELQHFWERPR